MTRPRFHCAAPSATALASSSRGTRSGMSDWYAGKPTAPAQPDASTISVTPHGGVASNAARIVRTAASAVCTLTDPRRRRRRGTRSASAPPSGPSSALGTNPAAATRPAQPACPVWLVTSTPTATVSIHVPMLEANAPVQKAA